jgi:hypothetical protein
MSVPLDQVSFLFLCLKYSTDGAKKIDFASLSKEYEKTYGPGSLSNDAARKRYLRLKARVEGTQIASDVRSPGGKVRRRGVRRRKGRGRFWIGRGREVKLRVRLRVEVRKNRHDV